MMDAVFASGEDEGEEKRNVGRLRGVHLILDLPDLEHRNVRIWFRFLGELLDMGYPMEF